MRAGDVPVQAGIVAAMGDGDQAESDSDDVYDLLATASPGDSFDPEVEADTDTGTLCHAARSVVLDCDGQADRDRR